MTTDTPSDDLVENLMRMTTGDAPTDPVSVMAAIAQSSREITRLRTDLTAMEACKNTYATLAYKREQEVFKLRAELAAAKREIYLAKRLEEARAQQPDWEKLWAEVSERAEQAERALAEALAQRDASDAVIATDGVGVWRNEAIARHRAKEGGK